MTALHWDFIKAIQSLVFRYCGIFLGGVGGLPVEALRELPFKPQSGRIHPAVKTAFVFLAVINAKTKKGSRMKLGMKTKSALLYYPSGCESGDVLNESYSPPWSPNTTRRVRVASINPGRNRIPLPVQNRIGGRGPNCVWL